MSILFYYAFVNFIIFVLTFVTFTALYELYLQIYISFSVLFHLFLSESFDSASVEKSLNIVYNKENIAIIPRVRERINYGF